MTYRPGDLVVTLRDVPRSPGRDNPIPKGTRAVVRRLSTVAPDVVRISIGDDTDPFGDDWLAVNVKDIVGVQLADSTLSTTPAPKG